MNELEIFKTNYWSVSHRRDTLYLGYLMVSSIEESDDIYKLSSDALNELGKVLCITEKILISVYSPYKVIMAKLGFSKGYNCHFHLLPISNNLLHQITEHPSYTNNEPDGVDALFFVNREYCDKKITQEQHDIILEAAVLLKKRYEETLLNITNPENH